MLKISILYFLLFGITILRAQGSYFALITEPQIGIPEYAVDHPRTNPSASLIYIDSSGSNITCPQYVIDLEINDRINNTKRNQRSL